MSDLNVKEEIEGLLNSLGVRWWISDFTVYVETEGFVWTFTVPTKEKKSKKAKG